MNTKTYRKELNEEQVTERRGIRGSDWTEAEFGEAEGVAETSGVREGRPKRPIQTGNRSKNNRRGDSTAA